jgi:acyl dehydratase
VPIPPDAVGTSTAPLEVTVERSRLRLFAKATGQRDPLWTDVDVAQAEGHPDLPVPPTFLFGLELERPEPFGWLTDLGIDMATVLHGEQRFVYHRLAHAGDTLMTASTITGVTSKKGGALELVDRRSEVTRNGEPVATLEQRIVVRNEVPA